MPKLSYGPLHFHHLAPTAGTGPVLIRIPSNPDRRIPFPFRFQKNTCKHCCSRLKQDFLTSEALSASRGFKNKETSLNSCPPCGTNNSEAIACKLSPQKYLRPMKLFALLNVGVSCSRPMPTGLLYHSPRLGLASAYRIFGSANYLPIG